jgi:site-specific DNA recombinase
MGNTKYDNRKVGIYSRKSRFTGKGESTNNQIETCKKKSFYIFPDLTEDDIVIYEDEGFTGYNTNRPDFQRMLKDIRANKLKAIAFYKLDRISRNVSDFTKLREDLDVYDVALLSATENIENVTPSGKAMLLMISVFAQLERDTIAERIRDNMLDLAKTGRWLGGNVPTGYHSEPVEKFNFDGKMRKLFKLTSVEDEKQDVKNLYAKMGELHSIKKLSDWAMSNGMKTKNGHFYTRFSIRRILTNPVYAIAGTATLEYFRSFGIDIFAEEEDFDGKRGMMVYNKTKQSEKRKILNEIDEWVVSVGKHEGFISGREWIEVQNIVKNNRDMKNRKTSTARALLSGIIRCKHCGAFMRPKLRAQGDMAGGKRVYDYMCELKDHSKKVRCQCPNINGLKADKLVMDEIKKLTMSDSNFYKALKNLSKEVFDKEDEKTAQLKSLQFHIQKNERNIASLLEKIKFVDIELLDDVQGEIKALKKENKELEKKAKELSVLNYDEVENQQTAEMIINIIDTYMTSVDSLNVNTRRMLLKLLTSSITTDGTDIFIDFIGARNITPSDDIKGGRILSSRLPTGEACIYKSHLSETCKRISDMFLRFKNHLPDRLAIRIKRD